MNKYLRILGFGSYSLAQLMAEIFISIRYAYQIISRAIPDGQLVSTEAETKVQISKKAMTQMLEYEPNGAAKRA